MDGVVVEEQGRGPAVGARHEDGLRPAARDRVAGNWFARQESAGAIDDGRGSIGWPRWGCREQ
jgi:hypothetical protein